MKTESRSIKWDGKLVSFREIAYGKKFVQARKRYRFDDVCPLCKLKFPPDDDAAVVLVISNQVGIPNRILHASCLEDKTDEYAFRLIAEDFELSKDYADWFPS